MKTRIANMTTVITAVLLAVCMLSACSSESRWQKQYDLGMQYLTEGNYEEAIVAFNAAISIEPNKAPAYVGRGNAYIGSGETEENLEAAMADYEKAIQLDAQNADAYLGMADVYIRQGNYDAAMELLKEALEATGNNESIASKISEMESGNITDSSGATRRSMSYDSTGNLIWYHDFTYNSDGTTASVTSYDSSGNQTGHVDLEYDENGRTAISFWHNIENGEVGLLKITYDAAGDIIREDSYDANGELRSYSMYERTSDNILQREYYSGTGELQSIYISESDEQGRRIREDVYDSDERLLMYQEYKYADDGKLIERAVYGPDDKLTSLQRYLYDEDGNSAGYNLYDGEGNLQQSVTNERDHNPAENSGAKISIPDQESSQPAFEEMLVIDNDVCSIRIVGIDLDYTNNVTIYVEFENKSDEMQHDFFVRAAVNGVQCSTSFEAYSGASNVAEIAAGEKAEPEIVLYKYSLGEDGIGDYTDIELTFSVCENGNWFEAVVEETVHIYPYGEDKAVSFSRKSRPSDNVIIDNEYMTAIVIGYEKEDTDDDYAINMFIANHSDSVIRLFSGDVTINGNEVDGFLGIDSSGEVIYPGKCKYSTLWLYGTEVEAMDYDDVGEICLPLEAYINGFENEIFNKEIILNP